MIIRRFIGGFLLLVWLTALIFPSPISGKSETPLYLEVAVAIWAATTILTKIGMLVNQKRFYLGLVSSVAYAGVWLAVMIAQSPPSNIDWGLLNYLYTTAVCGGPIVDMLDSIYLLYQKKK